MMSNKFMSVEKKKIAWWLEEIIVISSLDTKWCIGHQQASSIPGGP